MKVVIIVGLNPFHENSASANRWRTLIEGLNDLGVSISILITGGFNSLEEIKLYGRKGDVNGIKIHYLNYLYYGNRWFSRLNSYILLKLIKPFVKLLILRFVKKNHDAIFWTSSDLDAFKLVVDIKNKYPNIRTFLEMSEFLDIHKYNKVNRLHYLKGEQTQKYFEKCALHSYDGLALMTKTLFKYYSGFNLNKPQLLHLPMTVDLERFEKNVEKLTEFESPYIAYVGIMNNAKDGIDILIQSFAKIHHLFPEYRVYFVGPWHYDTPSQLVFIKDLGLDDKIFWKGVYSRDKVTSIIKHASLLVLPRPDSKQAQGGFPTKLGEYLASGNPVCATKVGEIPDYLSDNESVFFADPGSVDSFAEAMYRALKNPEDSKEIGKNGKKVAKTHFNKEIQSKILLDFFESQMIL